MSRLDVMRQWVDEHECSIFRDYRYMLVQQWLDTESKWGSQYQTKTEALLACEKVVREMDGWVPYAIVDLDTGDALAVDITLAVRVRADEPYDGWLGPQPKEASHA